MHGKGDGSDRGPTVCRWLTSLNAHQVAASVAHRLSRVKTANGLPGALGGSPLGLQAASWHSRLGPLFPSTAEGGVLLRRKKGSVGCRRPTGERGQEAAALLATFPERKRRWTRRGGLGRGMRVSALWR
jgi:hypothetical protein